MSGLKLALFDLDGTLVDSRALIAESMDEAFRVNGLPGCSYDQVRQIVGIELFEAIPMLLPEDYPPEGAVKVANTFREIFVRNRADGTHTEGLYPGARDLLDRLDRDGWLLGVTTGKPRRGLNHVLDTHDLHGLFVTLNTSCTGPGKPNPRMVLEAMNETGAEAHQTIVIGDSSHDIQMARNAKVRAAGVAWGFHTAEELDAAGAHSVHEDFACLERGLAAFGEMAA
ncbi:HAD-IA family hydrolase [Hyphobacterium sp. HN65]|uniref:HAD-IA family hydrolase n=1 Tax=Hyphobacterium lacteum TaxID=3116575 RepID=A0ABU7LMM4_9PROT|nr:HAD-IA family hydrolase [Hyphobacterium sp. HN65]MEE2525183.1 HAD-IA family hydrolase [Hyphobacterium sp. HN65]